MKQQREGCIALFVAYLRQHGLLEPDSDGRRPVDVVPPGVLLELAALLQIENWHNSGLGSLLGDAIPSIADADREFEQRTMEGPNAFALSRGWPLVCAVVDVWLDRLAARGAEILGAEVVLSDLDEDLLIEGVAQLLWNNRKQPAEELPFHHAGLGVEDHEAI